MTKQLKKVNFTFRITKELRDQIEKEASALGISKNAYITMTLHKALNKNK